MRHMLSKFLCNNDLTLIVPTNWCHMMLTFIYNKQKIPNMLLPIIVTICKFECSKKFILAILQQYLHNVATCPQWHGLPVVCPSIWGWNALDIANLVPQRSCNAFLVNLGSLSFRISLGRPWNLYTWSQNDLIINLIIT